MTCGGTSGGEGALNALKGSPLGVGTDLAGKNSSPVSSQTDTLTTLTLFSGSIRVPGAFCGLYGLKPSYGRIPYSGTVSTLEGQESVTIVLGPLSNSLSGIKTFMQSVIAQKPWLKDPDAVRKKWDDDEYTLVDMVMASRCVSGFSGTTDRLSLTRL